MVRPRASPRMESSLAAHWLLEALGLAHKSSPFCLALPDLASHWAGLGELEGSRSHFRPCPHLCLHVLLPTSHLTLKEGSTWALAPP